jgi:hypothetical protein
MFARFDGKELQTYVCRICCSAKNIWISLRQMIGDHKLPTWAPLPGRSLESFSNDGNQVCPNKPVLRRGRGCPFLNPPRLMAPEAAVSVIAELPTPLWLW